MKKKILCVFLSLGAAFALASCGEQGEKGETGPKGSDAAQYYPVTFRNEDGSFIDVQFVESGKSASFDSIPSSSKGYSYKFTGWDKEFDNIEGPTTITAKYDHSKIYTGTYPQGEVKSESLIAELNALAGDLPTSEDTKAWTDYDYYIGESIASYMYYQDIDYDNDGTYDYRGVYFTQYRPTAIDNYGTPGSASESRQDENGYETNKIYWFSYDPIEWDVLETKKGSALIIADLVLDNQEFYPSEYGSIIEHNGGMGYPNNYELSNIRKWLNENFYDTAFTSIQKNVIEVTKVDNSAKSTMSESNTYYCDDTYDEIFLLSYQEVLKYFPQESDRADESQSKVTEYAKCQGLSMTGNVYYSLLRSTCEEDGGAVNAIVTDDGLIGTYMMCDVLYGVRPACWINL